MKLGISSKLYVSAAVFSIVAFNGCNKKDDAVPENPAKVNYALTVTGGTGSSRTTYLFGTHDFPADNIGTANAAELASSGTMYRYGSNVYVSTFGAPATLRKYNFDDAGKPVSQGSFSVPGLKTFGAVDFISETEAYAASNGYGGVPKLVRFNPSNMQIVSTIDISSVHKAASVGGDYYQGIVHRDNYLFLGITYTDAKDMPLYDSVYVAVIDRNTGTVSKLLADGRSSEMWNGGTEASFQPNVFVKDESGDIYVMGFASRGKPGGVLRIKAGTTVFDPAYFFDLSATTGGPCLGLYYFGAANVFTVHFSDPVFYPFDSDTSYTPGAKAEYYKINLAAKTTSGNIAPTLPKVFGNYTFMTKWDNDKIYFNVPAASSNAIYSYQISDGAVKKEFSVAAGRCNGFTKL